MVNKKVIIGLGVLAVAGIGYYMWKNKKSTNLKVSDSGITSEVLPSEVESDENGDLLNFTGIRKTKSCCVKEVNGMCTEYKDVHYLTPCPNSKKAQFRTIPMPQTGICPRGYMVGVNGTYCRPIPASMIREI